MSDPKTSSSRWHWGWPAAVMMAIIFIGSTDLGAASHQSRFLLPVMHWLGFSDATVQVVLLAIRKLGHLTEYALLAIFVWRAWMLRPVFRPPLAWHWSEALLPLAICVAYAALDEFHQSFVPSRGASVRDVLVDVCGAIIGLILLWRWHRAQLARAGR